MSNTSGVKLHGILTAFSISEISVFDNIRTHVSHVRSAHVYVGCDTVQMSIPQKVIVVESRKCDTMPQKYLDLF